MDKIIINGGKPLNGEVTISGAKNAAVAIIPAALLSDGICRIENVPDISDTTTLFNALYKLGASVKKINKTTVEIDCRSVKTHIVPKELTESMRASYYFMGALMGKFRKAVVAPPGGCNFGVRPIDLHIKGFKALGAEVSFENGDACINAENLLGNTVFLDTVSVGATINIILAAVKAKGLTIIENAAKEPHIVDLANFLNSMGADIFGAGTDVIKIHGVDHLNGTTYSIIPDQIEAGTYMVAAAATKGNVLIKNVIPKHLESISAKLVEMGIAVVEYDDSVRVSYTGELTKCNVKTFPHPGFPTDMQPQIATLLTVAKGTSIITESVWDNRFRYMEELTRMGASVQVDGTIAVIEGVDSLKAARVKALDLRAGAAMVIAGLMCKGTTEIENIQFIERGYEEIVSKLRAMGADIKKITIPTSVSSVG